MRRMGIWIGVAMMLAPVTALGSTVQLSLYGTLSDGGTASGIITVDSSGGVNPSPVTVFDGGLTYTFQGAFIQLPYLSLGGGQYVVSYTTTGVMPSGSLVLAFPETSLVGFVGGALCSTSAPCTNNYAASYFTAYPVGPVLPSVNFTSLTASAVPEPATIALVGTGMLRWAASKLRRGRRG